ncbi:hypothetical protein IFM89_007869 [Coptis chinensis]|uniref:Uncharacterized protein n=1 Tax=Coptis chinensis TaxID=261450 RepID=A0A835GX88_9MAGN|nr:hypothetical protein IFM89_007869 [Coptis chinensis]
MLTGKEAWDFDLGDSKNEILYRIGYTDELPYIPSNLSVDAQDFLKKCLVKNVASRWSIDMLLSHPFIAGDYNKEVAKGKGTREAAAEVVLRFCLQGHLLLPICLGLNVIPVTV